MTKRLIAVAVAVLAPVLLWVIVVQLAGHRLTVSSPDGRAVDVGVPQILFFAIVPALAGWGLLAALERFFPRRGTLAWLIIAGVLLLISFAPLGGEMSAATRLTLGAMHLLVGGALIAGLPRRSTPRPA